MASRVVLASLRELKHGLLRLELPDGSMELFGDPAASSETLLPQTGNTALIRVRSPKFFQRCLLAGDIGFAESYLECEWETPDLTAVISWFILNHERAPTLSGSRAARQMALNLLRGANLLLHWLRPNTRATARRNIAAHYDLSNEFFALWLGPTMMYSGAIFPTDRASLDEAQSAKNDALCRKLQLQPSDHVLEIGTGWGGWCVHAATHYGCRVTTVTISQAQYDFARARVAAAGLGGRVRVELRDYRDLEGTYDKIVSIEMLEAVGHRFLPAFAAACARHLRPDGLLGLQFITCPDSRYDQFRAGVDFIQKHVFPGSLLLSINRVNQLLTQEGGFLIHSLEDHGRSYVQTLRAWRDAFHAATAQVSALGFDEQFRRKWHYYLCYCEAAFAMRNISVVQTVHTRPNNLRLR